MRTSDLIMAKREGQAHSREEIFNFIFDATEKGGKFFWKVRFDPSFHWLFH